MDDGAAEAAFLLRPPTVEQVAALARAGAMMPQKSTYFFPKLLSGLLFHPLVSPVDTHVGRTTLGSAPA